MFTTYGRRKAPNEGAVPAAAGRVAAARPSASTAETDAAKRAAAASAVARRADEVRFIVNFLLCVVHADGRRTTRRIWCHSHDETRRAIFSEFIARRCVAVRSTVRIPTPNGSQDRLS